MTKIAIVGFGELGKQILNLIQQSLKENLSIVCFDDFHSSTVYKSFPFNNYLSDEFQDHSFFIALGYKHLPTKNKIIRELIAKKRKLPPVIHPSGYISSSAFIHDGCLLYPMCNVDKEVIINTGSLLNNSVIVSHNSVIGACCYVSPGVVISGDVKIGDNTFIGSGAVISNGVNVGNNVTIGIGSVITQDIADNSSVIGNPARIVERPIKLK